MLTELDMQFIEVAAPVVMDLFAERHKGPTCIARFSSSLGPPRVCGLVESTHPSRDQNVPPGPPALPTLERHAFRNKLGPAEQLAAYPYARDAAASLHGRLLERNGCKTADEIVAAASEPSTRKQRCEEISFGHSSTEPFDTAAFFRAIAIEAMGGAKWTGEHHVLLRCNPTIRQCGKPHQWIVAGDDGPAMYMHSFSVPSIEEAQS